VGSFEVVAVTGPRLSPEIVREVGAAFASYVDTPTTAPFHTALTDLLAEPMESGQLLNCVVGLSNVVGLLVLTLAQDEESASNLARTLVARAASASVQGVFDSVSDPRHQDTQAWICRVYGTADGDTFPSEVTGEQLVALAAYGDAAIVLADRVGLPRNVLGPALSTAAAKM